MNNPKINALFDGVAPYADTKLKTRPWKIHSPSLGWIEAELESILIADAMRELEGKIERGEYKKCDPSLPKL